MHFSLDGDVVETGDDQAGATESIQKWNRERKQVIEKVNEREASSTGYNRDGSIYMQASLLLCIVCLILSSISEAEAYATLKCL